MNLCTKQKQTHRHRKQTCGCQGRGRKGVGTWDSRDKLIYRVDKQQGPIV